MAIQLRYRVNAGIWRTGGDELTSTYVGATCELGVVDASGVTQWYWEITDFPPSFGVPAGWSSSATGTYYSTASSPPSFAMGHWGKYTFRLTVNGGTKVLPDGSVVADPDKIDEASGLSIKSPQDLIDTAATEQGQWDARQAWIAAIKHNWRVMEAVLGTGGTGLKLKIIAKAALDTNVTLSGEQTLDGVALVEGDIFMAGGQTDPRQNGPWVVHAGAWTRPPEFPVGGAASGAIIGVAQGGTLFGGSIWFETDPSGSDVIGTNDLTFSLPNLGGLPLGTANTVYASNGVTNGWSGTPTVTSLTATGYVSVGATPAGAGLIRLTAGGYITSASGTLGNVELLGITGDTPNLGAAAAPMIVRSSYLGFTGTLPTAGLVRLPNNAFVYSRTTGGSNVSLIGLNGADALDINADGLVPVNIRSSGGVYIQADDITTNPKGAGLGIDVRIGPSTQIVDAPSNLIIKAASTSHVTGTGGILMLQGGTGASGDGAVQLYHGAVGARFLTTQPGINIPASGYDPSTYPGLGVDLWSGDGLQAVTEDRLWETVVPELVVVSGTAGLQPYHYRKVTVEKTTSTGASVFGLCLRPFRGTKNAGIADVSVRVIAYNPTVPSGSGSAELAATYAAVGGALVQIAKRDPTDVTDNLRFGTPEPTIAWTTPTTTDVKISVTPARADETAWIFLWDVWIFPV